MACLLYTSHYGGNGGDENRSGHRFHSSRSGAAVPDVHVPTSIRQGNGDGLGVGVEDGENLSRRLVDTERHTVFIFTVHRVDTALNILPCGQMKCLSLIHI